jgi:hypothetical protein
MDSIDVHMQTVSNSIKEMIDEKVNEKVLEILKRVSDVYKIDIDIKEIMKEARKMNIVSDRCMGKTAKGTQCKRGPCNDGYCKIHQGQKPKHNSNVPFVHKNPPKPRVVEYVHGFD